MSTRDQQEGYLASIAQAFDAGDFDYLSPDELRSLDTLIASAWNTFRQGGDMNSEIGEIEQLLGRK
jgi:HAMP domain-containing protein